MDFAFTDGAALADGSWAFSAVAEARDNSVDDGPCVASAIGVCDGDDKLRSSSTVAPKRKIEGVEASRVGARLRLSVVTDADDPEQPAELGAVSVRSRRPGPKAPSPRLTQPRHLLSRPAASAAGPLSESAYRGRLAPPIAARRRPENNVRLPLLDDTVARDRRVALRSIGALVAAVLASASLAAGAAATAADAEFAKMDTSRTESSRRGARRGREEDVRDHGREQGRQGHRRGNDGAHEKMTGKKANKATCRRPTRSRSSTPTGTASLTAEEHAAGAKRMFDKMDSDKDGFLTRAELAAGHAR